MATSSSLVLGRVLTIAPAAIDVKVFELGAADGGPLPAFTPGAHVRVHLPNVKPRPYSLCGDVEDRTRYRIAVLRQELGGGGSKYMHEVLRRGDLLEVSSPINNFPLIADAASYVFIAGGIGITPILPMLIEVHRRRAAFRLYYCAKSPMHAAFRDLLSASKFSGKVVFHYDGGDPNKGLDMRALFAQYVPGASVYCCGPAGLMRAVQRATSRWPREAVHFEHFRPAGADARLDRQEFEIVLAKSGVRLPVPSDKSMAHVLREHGLPIRTSCEEGICGTCRTRYLRGNPVHNDFVLTESEQRYFVMLCCARANGGIIELDL